MTKRCNILGVGPFCCVLMLVPGLASGQPFTVTSDDPGINVVPAFTHVSGNTWDLHVLVEHAASTATVDADLINLTLLIDAVVNGRDE